MAIDFPPSALPYCCFSVDGGNRRLGVGVGRRILDLTAVSARLTGIDPSLVTVGGLNPLLAAGHETWGALRSELTALLESGPADTSFVHQDAVALHLAWDVADYVDFYSSRQHAESVGRLFRPDADPLPAPWLHLPIGYHGRASSIVVDGSPVRRPSGQRAAPGGGPVFGPTERLDFELEVGFVVGGRSSPGEPIPIDRADEHLFGMVLVNDWSARDIQAWEYVPLGPFLGKSFATTVSAWVMPLEALESAHVPPPRQDPEPLPYLRGAGGWTPALDLEVWLRPAGSPQAVRVAAVDTAASLYWSPAQQLTHLTSNGAPISPGDLFATGTLSGSGPGQTGSLLEATSNGAKPIAVGEAVRGFLVDGDEVILTGAARTDAGPTPLGPARGVVLAPSR